MKILTFISWIYRGAGSKLIYTVWQRLCNMYTKLFLFPPGHKGWPIPKKELALASGGCGSDVSPPRHGFQNLWHILLGSLLHLDLGPAWTRWFRFKAKPLGFLPYCSHPGPAPGHCSSNHQRDRHFLFNPQRSGGMLFNSSYLANIWITVPQPVLPRGEKGGGVLAICRHEVH